MDFFKRFKLIFSSSKYSLRRISAASEKSLKVVQELRDMSKDIQSDLRYITKYEKEDRDSIELPHELKILGRQVLSTVIKNSCPHCVLVIIYNNTIKWHPISYMSSKSMLIREEISRDYLFEILQLCQNNKLGGLFFIVNLDDSYYQGPYEEFVWNYCGHTASSRGVVWPNMEAQRNFIGKIDAPDSLQWKQKIDNCCFYGSDTGSKDVECNDRVRIARLANELNSPLFTAKITDWVQIDASKLPFDRNTITGSYVSMRDQLKSKIVLSIDGNVSSWERPAWIMNSNSLLFKYESEFYDWYYDKLIDGHNYVLIKRGDDLMDKIRYYLKNEEASLAIIKNAHETVKNYLHHPQHLIHSRKLLEAYYSQLFV